MWPLRMGFEMEPSISRLSEVSVIRIVNTFLVANCLSLTIVATEVA